MPFVYVRHRVPLSSSSASAVTVLAPSEDGLPALEGGDRQELENGGLQWTATLTSTETCALLNGFDAKDWTIAESDALEGGEKVTTFVRDAGGQAGGGMGDLLKMFGMPQDDTSSDDSGSDVEEQAQRKEE